MVFIDDDETIPEFNRAKAKQFFEEEIPFCRFWGMKILQMEQTGIEIFLPYREELIGDPYRPALHGGVISALLDTAGGVAAMLRLDLTRETLSTIDMRVDYLRPGKLQDLIGAASVLRRGNKVIVTQMQAFHPEERIPIAEGRAVYGVSVSSPKV